VYILLWMLFFNSFFSTSMTSRVGVFSSRHSQLVYCWHQ